MPVYEYECEECKEPHDEWFSMKDKPQQVVKFCAKCKRVTTHKAILSPTGIHGFLYSQPEDR